ncbi:hypothetical protein AMATHDRAFT_60443 [Amanita thiersii Skay4041]|uniref:DUF866-domain-containing protein n=1 Tax=Amanita thiersii Skay4041 TaxID=703135 RepID=A0A2A9NSV8_9AGAR|nr:hypothetical protein AMATHDRAFT_60443 [Amanita thiersii Skay4041]
MVFLVLSISADLENVKEFQPASDDFDYLFKVKCTSCNEEHKKWITMNRTEIYEVSGGKHSTANFVWRCGLCKRESSAKFDPASPVKPYSSANGEVKPLVTIECRGLEFIDFDPKGDWKCFGIDSNLPFEVHLDDSEWTDYDEKAAQPVGITNIESQWTRG